MELEKMKLTSASGSELNREALYQIMPSAFTEVRDEKTGKITHKINFSTLRELLGDNAYDEADEEYGFKWVGKNAARREAARSINKTLRPCPEESVDWENTQNLYIEGDNLEVLKLLQKSYLGKIKMIYIDPPYNTGNDFVYRDDFAMDKDGYDRAAGDVDELGNRFRKNADGNARFHSDWCSMIYERLLVARALLSNDGVIFISIDDNEVENLKKICNEIFGDANHLGIVTWLKKRKGSFLSKGIISLSEYVLVYAKNRTSCLGIYGGEADASESQPIIKRTNRVSTLNIPANIIMTKLADGTYAKGSYGDDVNPVTLNNDIIVDKGIIITPFSISAPFVWSQRMFDDQLNKGAKFVINTMNFQIRVYRVYEDDNFKGFGSVINGVEIKGTNEDAYEDLERIFGVKKIFDYSKPTNLLKTLIDGATHFDKDAIVLDFFSGSAATAHAVMQLNVDDGGRRKYIMVQLPELTDKDSEPYNEGYRNICEIGKERIRRAGENIKEEAGEKAATLDTGFRVFKCEDSFMNDVYFSPAELQQQDLFAQISNIKDGTSDLSMLFGCMLDWGVQLSLPLSTFEVAGKTIYNVNDGDLVACFNENVNEDAISAIAELNPLRVVFRDSCFGDAPLKMNLFELFKQKCGWSEEVVKSRVHVI